VHVGVQVGSGFQQSGVGLGVGVGVGVGIMIFAQSCF